MRGHTAVWICFLVLCADALPAEAQDQQSPQSTGIQASEKSWPTLERLFADDFSKDTRGNYRVLGDVSWEPGRFTLQPDASIGQTLRAGAWTKVTLSLELPGLTAGQLKSEIQLWFEFADGVTPCFVRLRRTLTDQGPTAIIALVDTGEQDGKPVQESVREVTLADSGVRQFTVEYRYGMVQVWTGATLIFAAYIENGNTAVAGFRLTQASLPGSMTELSWSSSPPHTDLTAEQKQQLQNTTSISAELLAKYLDGKYADALPLGQKLLQIRKDVLGVQHPDYATSLNDLALLYDSIGDFGIAESLCVEAMEIRTALLGENHPLLAISLNNLGATYTSQGEYILAEPLFRRSVGIERAVRGENHAEYAMGLNNLALLYNKMGDYSRAEEFCRQAIAVHKAVFGELDPHYASSLGNLALLYEDMGDLVRAEPLYQQALQIDKSALGKEHPDYATSLNNLAGLYENMGDYAQAESLYQESVRITRTSLGDQHPDFATGLNNLAGLYFQIDDSARAEPLYEEALEIRRVVLGTRHPSYLTSLNNLAKICQGEGDYSRAEDLYRQAGETARAALGEMHPLYGLCLNNLASLYIETGRPGEAEPIQRQATQIFRDVLGPQHPSYATSLTRLASVCQLEGDYADAEALRRTSHSVLMAAANQVVPASSGAQATLWLQKHAPRTDLWLSSLRRTESAMPAEAYEAVWATKALISRLQTATSVPEDADEDTKKKVTELQQARLKLSRMVSATPEADQLPQFREAFAAASQFKEGLEKELARLNPVAKRRSKIRDASCEDLLMRLPAGVAVIDIALLNDWSIERKDITLKHSDGTSETRTVKSEQSTPVLDAFVLRNDRKPGEDPVNWVQLGPAEPIDAAITLWRSQLTGEDADFNDLEGGVTSAGSAPQTVLRQLIWDKLEPHLAGCHTVILLPDGSLNQLPWAALPGRKPMTFLLEDYALATAGYGQQLYGLLSDELISGAGQLFLAGGLQYDQRPLPANNPEIQSIGNPQTLPLVASRSRSAGILNEDRNWAYLDGSEREATTIRSLWMDRGPVQFLDGVQADESTVSAALASARYSHLATHGFFDKAADIHRVNLRQQSLFETSSQHGATVAARNPLLMTGIVLTGASLEPSKDQLGLPTGEDGILTAEELVGLDLHNSELVTLSACETGLGDVANGEGVYGLTRALHQAGVRSVVASLWKVDDAATVELMTRFYTNLWVKKQSKIESLRNAQLHILRNPLLPDGTRLNRGELKKRRPPARDAEPDRDATDPYFWAAWTLSGDWR